MIFQSQKPDIIRIIQKFITNRSEIVKARSRIMYDLTRVYMNPSCMKTYEAYQPQSAHYSAVFARRKYNVIGSLLPFHPGVEICEALLR